MNRIYEHIELLEKEMVESPILVPNPCVERYKNFYIHHLGIESDAQYIQFKARYDTWKLRKSDDVEKMRNWERETNRGTYRQQTPSI